MYWREINGAVTCCMRGGSGPAVVLIHEMGGNLHSYADLAADLEADFTVLRYDLRGAGLSEKVTGRLSEDDLVADLAALIRAEELGPVVLLGAAVGAGIALLAAERYPDLIRGVVGLSPVVACPGGNPAGVLGHAGRIETEGLRALAPNSLATLWPDIPGCSPEARAAGCARWLANDPRSFAAIYRMAAHLDLSARLPSVTRPALMIAAGYDSYVSEAAVRAIADALPQGSFAQISSGHVAAAQNPDLVAVHLRSFIAGLPAL